MALCLQLILLDIFSKLYSMYKKLSATVLSLILAVSFVPAFAEPNDCLDEREQLGDAIFLQMQVAAQSHSLFDIGNLNGMNTAKGAFDVTGNDCAAVVSIIDNLIPRYERLVEQSQQNSFQQYYLGLMEGLGSARNLIVGQS